MMQIDYAIAVFIYMQAKEGFWLFYSEPVEEWALSF